MVAGNSNSSNNNKSNVLYFVESKAKNIHFSLALQPNICNRTEKKSLEVYQILAEILKTFESEMPTKTLKKTAPMTVTQEQKNLNSRHRVMILSIP